MILEGQSNFIQCNYQELTKPIFRDFQGSQNRSFVSVDELRPRTSRQKATPIPLSLGLVVPSLNVMKTYAMNIQLKNKSDDVCCMSCFGIMPWAKNRFYMGFIPKGGRRLPWPWSQQDRRSFLLGGDRWWAQRTVVQSVRYWGFKMFLIRR